MNSKRQSNRCPKCGGQAQHLVTDVKGDVYNKCGTGLTSFEKDGDGSVVRTSRIVACDTIIDQQGRAYTGTIAYRVGGKAKTIAVTDGKERR